MVHMLFAHAILAIAIAIMGAALMQTTRLLEIVEGSKAEAFWKQSQIGIFLLTIVYIVIMVSRLLENEVGEASIHDILMNTAFLLTSILLLKIVNLDIQAFKSLFELLADDPNEL